VLSDPKRIEWLVDGTVAVREHLPANVERQLLFDSQQDQFTDWVGHGAWVAEADGTITVPISEDDHFFINTLWGRGLAWEAEFLLSTTSVASLIVRGNPSTMAGYRIGLDSERGVVGLYRLFPAQPETIIQERAVALASDQWHNLKIVVQGDFFDVYVDDTLLVRHERTYREGCFGLHARGAICALRVISAPKRRRGIGSDAVNHAIFLGNDEKFICKVGFDNESSKYTRTIGSWNAGDHRYWTGDPGFGRGSGAFSTGR